MDKFTIECTEKLLGLTRTKILVECKIAGKLNQNSESIKKFGCSDFKCRSHLFYSINLNDLNNYVPNAYDENGLNLEICPGQV